MGFDEQIQKAQADIESLREPLREQSDRWLDATATWGASRWARRAQELVTQQPEVTKDLGKNLGGVKAEVDGLVEHALARAAEHFTEGSHAWMWPHLRENMEDPIRDPSHQGTLHPHTHFKIQPYRKKEGPYALSKPVEEFGALVETLLRKHGYRPTYQPTIWSDSMLEEMERLWELEAQLVANQGELQRLTRAKAEAEAGDLWEQA